MVVLEFFIGNDVVNNSLILESKAEGRSINDRAKPFFILNNGKLEELPFGIKVSKLSKNKEQTKRDVTGWFQIQGILARFFPNIYYSLSDRINETPWLANFLWKLSVKKSKPELPDKFKKDEIFMSGDYIYAEQYPPVWENAWEVTEGLILKLANELKMDNIGFLVVVIPNESEFRPDKWNKFLDEHDQMKGIKFDLRKPERILSKYLETNNIDYLLLRPEFEKYVRETGKDLHFHRRGDNHWNADGHVLTAQLIYRKLRDDKLIPTKGEDRHVVLERRLQITLK